MKTNIRTLTVLRALFTGLALLAHSESNAQTFKTLYSFTNGGDGAQPIAGLTPSGTRLYGVTTVGGVSSNGTVFAINTDGSGFTVLHTFTGNDGSSPWGGLLLSGDTLYGTAVSGGLSNSGTLFSLRTNGLAFTNFYSFSQLSFTHFIQPPDLTNLDGSHPYAGLALSGGVLYGTTGYGGASGDGTIFKINPDGTGFETLQTLNGSNGSLPNSVPAVSGSRLFITTANGGISGDAGTLSALDTTGSNFTLLHDFNIDGGSNGATLFDGVIVSGNRLYGTVTYGGPTGTNGGAVFAVNTDGTGFTNLHYFAGGSEGSEPYDSLTLSGNTLYGTTLSGGDGGNGTVFSLNTDGSGFTTLYRFSKFSNTAHTNADGAAPQDSVIISGNTLYGTTTYGGAYGFGTIFSLTLPAPQLTIAVSGSNVTLAWPATNTGLTLQSATSLTPPIAWTPVSATPSTANGQTTVTLPITAARQFFQLSP
jgi:uncharacterized repeat protein (TIGR03803 family)